jgi:Undecaprenyl-phosphate galactose phosphotransferase WbaP
LGVQQNTGEELVASLTSLRLANRVELAVAELDPATEPRYRPVICSVALVAADGVAGALSWCFAALVRYGLGWGIGGIDVTVSPASGLLFTALFVYLASQGRYSDRIMFWNELRQVVGASACAALVAAALGLLTSDVAAGVTAALALAAFPAVATAGNRLAKQILNRLGIWGLPIVVIGDGASATQAEAALTSDALLGYRFVGRADADSVLAVVGTPSLRSVLRRYGARQLLIALDEAGDRQRRIIECALREQVPFAMVPPPRALPAFAFQAAPCFGQDPVLLSCLNRLSRPSARMIKTAMDLALAAPLLLLISPLFLVFALLSRLDGGPLLFAHRRIGAGGRPFSCLKFRTMVMDGDRVLSEALARDPALAAEWAATRKLVDDPRVTRIGQFLRKTSLDELPQLINVLRRDMSLVGPRPIVESEIPLYGEAMAQYCATRPGITGLWQVSGRSDISYARRVELDVWYVNNWTVWNDITLLLKTIPAVLARRGAR